MARGPRVGDEITLTATILKVMEDGVSSVSIPTYNFPLAIDTPKARAGEQRAKVGEQSAMESRSTVTKPPPSIRTVILPSALSTRVAKPLICREGIGGTSGQISGQQRSSLRQLPVRPRCVHGKARPLQARCAGDPALKWSIAYPMRCRSRSLCSLQAVAGGCQNEAAFAEL
ncbi:hypothetical protein EJ073_28710 [Mesorhizobium sp. M4B.F.Ca.ET.058.02.1.1]|nr:hypothetical protein EJ073_28710 [Mesorhizobium sp. M4B.F.Ca.ET.058.02.1.1]